MDRVIQPCSESCAANVGSYYSLLTTEGTIMVTMTKKPVTCTDLKLKLRFIAAENKLQSTLNAVGLHVRSLEDHLILTPCH